jgi:mRNA-degrading endonuclease YafQ of YafQ-DinJ toxin-antitoxin module
MTTQTRIDYSRTFDKQLKKAPHEIKTAFRKRFALFLVNPFHSQLRNHALKGEDTGFRSINITGD